MALIPPQCLIGNLSWQIDNTSAEYRLLHPSAFATQQPKPTVVDGEHFEEVDDDDEEDSGGDGSDDSDDEAGGEVDGAAAGRRGGGGRRMFEVCNPHLLNTGRGACTLPVRAGGGGSQIKNSEFHSTHISLQHTIYKDFSPINWG